MSPSGARPDRVTEPVPEEAVRLAVNDVELGSWTASPTALEELGVGRLVHMGFVRGPGDVLDTRTGAGETTTHRIEVRVPDARLAVGIEERDHRAWHGCGIRYLLDCRPDLLPERRASDQTLAVPDPDAFPALFRELFDRSRSRQTTGGHHTTALTDGARLLHVFEEVGRHNGADKAIGSAILAGDDLRSLGLLTTARVSGQIAEKAARAGIAWVASRSVPTTLAVEIAGRAGMPVVARAPGRDIRVFT